MLAAARFPFILAALAAVWLLAPPAWAADVTVENQTGRAIRELRWSRPTEPGRPVTALPNSALTPGAVRSLPGPESPRADLIAIFEDGSILVYHGLEPGGYRHLELGPDEAALFEWNPEKPSPQ
jgi:hypothetical protein